MCEIQKAELEHERNCLRQMLGTVDEDYVDAVDEYLFDDPADEDHEE